MSDSEEEKTRSRPEEEEEEKTIESMDSQEFLNQHNDECDVCNLGGELLCCSTCTLVFHVECVRPRLEELPDGEWACAYCVLSGNEYKKHSKVWKAAAAAVRHMGRLRNSKQREQSSDDEDEDDHKVEEQENNESKDDDNTKEEPSDGAVPSVAETEKHDNKTLSAGGSKQKKSLALYKISDALSPSFKVETSESTGRGRRPRRQPILYDPQICPDSRWKSDDPHVKDSSTMRSDEDEDNSDEAEGEEILSSSRKRRRSRDKQGDDKEDEESASRKETGEKPDAATMSDKDTTPSNKSSPSVDNEKKGKQFHWCNFCHDDPNIPICVFCACRVCYGKHEKEKLLLCDQCDEEYHIFCLKPPLSSVPTTKKWFCPACKAASVGESKVSTRRVSPTKSSTGGTPTSTRSTKKEKSIVTTPKSVSKSGNDGDSNSSPAKRPRGRPPKNKSPQPPTDIALTPPRKRGRPPKNAQPFASPPASETPTPRKRGRPPKNPPTVTAPVARKKPGPKSGSTNKRSVSPSTRKVDAPSTAKKVRTDQPVEEAPHPEPIKISRSGRIVKRSSFHDEVEEGEQHLRSRRSESDEMSEKHQSEEDGSHGDSAGDATMGTEEDMAGHEEVHTGHGCDDDEMSEDTGDGRPVRTKVIEPPSTTVTLPLPVVAMEVDEPNLTSPEPASVPDPAPVPVPDQGPETLAQPPIQVQEVVVDAVEVPKEEKPLDDSKSKTVATLEIKAADLTESSAMPPTSDHKEMETPPEIGSPVDKVAVAPTPVAQPGAPTQHAQAPPKRDTAKVVSKKAAPPKLQVDVKALVKAAIANIPTETEKDKPNSGPVKVPRRKPGARECMQISRRFGVRVIPKKYMDTLLDYCTRGKVEHLIRMRERLDEHSRYLEAQLAGLEAVVREKGETDVVVPQLPERAQVDAPLTSRSFQPMNAMSSETASMTSMASSTKSTTKNVPTMVKVHSMAAPAGRVAAKPPPASIPGAASTHVASVVTKTPAPTAKTSVAPSK